MACVTSAKILNLLADSNVSSFGNLSKNMRIINPNSCRHVHTALSRPPRIFRNNLGLHNSKYKWFRVTAVRFNSTNTSTIATGQQDLTTLTEPALSTLGLGGWGPVGLLQNALEFLHIGCDLPWYLAIAAGTCVVRIIMSPLIIFAQRNAAKMHNNMPQMQILQMKMSEARRNGDALEASKYGYELMKFMKDKDMNPLKNFVVPMAQAPVFISFFMAIRGMANLPLESMKTGGLYWFTNLTVADPFYILPIITCTTLLITIEIGAEGGVRMDNMQMMRYVLRCLPFVIFPFVMNFPAGILCYWVTSNFITLIQVAVLRLPPVRDFFKIERLVHHSKESLPMTKKNVVSTFKDAMTNAKIAKEIEDRGRTDEIRFRKAGLGPIQKTYRYDPTKQSQSPAMGAKATERR